MNPSRHSGVVAAVTPSLWIPWSIIGIIVPDTPPINAIAIIITAISPTHVRTRIPKVVRTISVVRLIVVDICLLNTPAT